MAKRGPIYGTHDSIEQVDSNPGYTGLLRPAGPVDPQITFLSVQSTVGKPIARLASYGLHYVGRIPANTISTITSLSSPIAWASYSVPTGISDPPFVGINAQRH